MADDNGVAGGALQPVDGLGEDEGDPTIGDLGGRAVQLDLAGTKIRIQLGARFRLWLGKRHIFGEFRSGDGMSANGEKRQPRRRQDERHQDTSTIRTRVTLVTALALITLQLRISPAAISVIHPSNSVSSDLTPDVIVGGVAAVMLAPALGG